MVRNEEPWPEPEPPPYTPLAEALKAARIEQERARKDRPTHVPLTEAR